jgi:hypothetical protein
LSAEKVQMLAIIKRIGRKIELRLIGRKELNLYTMLDLFEA